MNGIIKIFNISFCLLFRVLLKKSGTKIPRIELEEIGPRMDLTIRRQKLASDILFKQACKKPKELKVIFYLHCKIFI